MFCSDATTSSWQKAAVHSINALGDATLEFDKNRWGVLKVNGEESWAHKHFKDFIVIDTNGQFGVRSSAGPGEPGHRSTTIAWSNYHLKRQQIKVAVPSVATHEGILYFDCALFDYCNKVARTPLLHLDVVFVFVKFVTLFWCSL